MKSKSTLLSFFWLLLLAGFAGADDIYFSSTQKYEHVLVEKVLNTNTIILQGGEKVKLIGLKALEPPRKERTERDEFGFIAELPEDPISSLEEQAFSFAKNLLEGKHVRLEFDVRKKTSELHTCAYIYLDELLVNAEFLRQGFAHLQIAAPNLKHSELLRAAYREAREEKRGIHNE